MPNPYFSFKQFTVFHGKCAMKVGIDGVLLGAWSSVEQASTILDVGTGSGLIALMLAQRSNAQIDAIDIDTNAIIQAKENCANSLWDGRILLYENSLQQFLETCTTKYDLIVSNPPYFVNSLKAPDETRATARHTDTLSHESLLSTAKQLLKETGRICLILPVNEGLQCVDFANNINLYCRKKVVVYPKPNANPKRLLLEFSLIPCSTIESELTIESNERHHYSPEFTLLAKDYYLKL